MKRISLSGIFFLVLIISCTINEPVVRDNYIELGEGETNFIAAFESLDNPKGILPSTINIGRGNKNIILKVPSDYYEYFAFDSDSVIILLSFEPYYFIKIKSKQISNHFNNEYNQFYNNVRLLPSSKNPSSNFYQENLGKYQVSIQFTPSELSYSSDSNSINSIRDIYADNDTDPSILINSSEILVYYTPLLEDPTLYNLIDQQIKGGQKRYLYTNQSPFPPIYSEEFNSLNFSFMYFKGIQGSSSDQITLYSLPLGDSTKTGDRDYLRKSHGVTVSIRGDLALFRSFFEKKGFSFSNPPSTINKFYAERVGDTQTVKLSWSAPSNVKLEYRRRLKNPIDYPSAWHDLNWQPVADNLTNTSFEINNIELGYHYYFRLTDNSTGKQFERNIIIPIDPSSTASISSVDGTVVSGDLAFTEISLVGSGETFVNSYGNTQIVKRDDAWFEIMNISDKIIRLDNIDFYFHNSELGSTLQSEIIFGKNCTSSDINRQKVSAVMYPKELYVFSKHSNYIFADVVIRNLAIRYFPDIIPANNVLIAKIGSTVLDSLDTDSNRGTVATRFSSSVFAWSTTYNRYQWQFSSNNFMLINPFSVYCDMNYCTPGLTDSGEYGF